MSEWPTFEEVLSEYPTMIPGVELLAKAKGVSANEVFLQINAESFRRRGDALDIPYLAGLSNMTEAEAERILGMEMSLSEAKMIARLARKYDLPMQLKADALGALAAELRALEYRVKNAQQMFTDLKGAIEKQG